MQTYCIWENDVKGAFTGENYPVNFTESTSVLSSWRQFCPAEQKEKQTVFPWALKSWV